MSGDDPQRPRTIRRFGAAELFGQPLCTLEAAELRRLSGVPNSRMECPFKSNHKPCSKKGGVCSLIAFEKDQGGHVRTVGTPVTTCPNRFLENENVFHWVGEVLLGTAQPMVVSQVPFLMSKDSEAAPQEDEVGRIDNVLVSVRGRAMTWCALEMQAVYFSGGKMEDDFVLMRGWRGPGLPFPERHRRPDYRSSGPKRLMPQLQIKVPTLRRWGKKMAVVVDKAFWQSLREMRTTKQVSNADITWFIVGYEGPSNGRYRLAREDTVFTTLESAVEGLTGGTAVSLEQFEQAIWEKLERSSAT